jgi:hypothetical protein
VTIQFPDVSHYQSGLSLKGAPAVIAKATQGNSYRDPAYAGFKAQAAALGIPFAAYHWLDTTDAAAQARNAYAVVGPNVALMIDDEQGVINVGHTLAFVAPYRKLGGRVVLEYAPRWVWQNSGSPDLRPLAAAGLSLVSSSYPSAGYTDSGPGWVAYGGVTPVIWQYSDKQAFGGQRVDFNAYRGTAAQLRALLGAGSTTTQEDDMDFNQNAKLDAVFNLYPKVKLDTDAVTDGKGGIQEFPVPLTEALNRIEEKLDKPAINVDLGELASQVLANAGFADAIATAVADKLAARLKD